MLPPNAVVASSCCHPLRASRTNAPKSLKQIAVHAVVRNLVQGRVGRGKCGALRSDISQLLACRVLIGIGVSQDRQKPHSNRRCSVTVLADVRPCQVR